MKVITKRTFTAIIACIMACVMFTMPVCAATMTSSYFSKSTTKLNAISGGTSSTSSLSSGSVPSGATVTQVKLACNVSSGTDPYTIYIKSPNETSWHTVTGPTSSTTLYLEDFDGQDPSGTWKIYIANSGYTTHNNVYPVSTVTISMTVYYEY